MSTITINGNNYSGNSISVANGKIIVDGKDVTPDSREINIIVKGDINELTVDSCNKVSITGNVKNVTLKSGDIDIAGNVTDSIQTVSGNVGCGNVGYGYGNVGGSIATMSGNVAYIRA